MYVCIGGIKFCGPLVQLPIRQIKFSTNISCYTVYHVLEAIIAQIHNMKPLKYRCHKAIVPPSYTHIHTHTHTQMRSIVDGDINLLPQWSQPINVPLEVLPPPDISSSRLLSLILATNSQEGFLLVEASIELAWSKPEGVREDMEGYEVWVGSVPLEGYEEASQQLGDIVPFEVQSVTPALLVCVCRQKQ